MNEADHVEEDYLRTADGVRLYARRRRPEADSRALRLYVIHGYAEHCRRYGFLEDDMVERGWEVRTGDLRGHGDSEGARGFVADFDDYLLDLDTLILEDLGERPGPFFLIGHSMGALAVTRWLQQRQRQLEALELRGVMLSSPFFALKLKVAGIKRFAAELLSGVWPGFALANELKASDLTRDETVQSAWEADDRMVRKVPARWFTEALRAQELAFRDAGRMPAPTLIFHGSEDPVADPDASRRFNELLKGEGHDYRSWPGLRHEIFNEVERGDVFDALHDWLKAHAGRPVEAG